MKILKCELGIHIKNSMLVIVGTLILAFATSLFVLPHNLIIGGVSGIGIILDSIIWVEFITEELVITVLTWGLFFVGWLILGKRFAVETLISSIVFPLAIMLFNRIGTKEFMNGFFMMDPSDSSHLVIGAVFYGILGGVGCAMTYLGGGSTGGSDILGLILAKYCKRLKSSVAIGMVDASIVISGMFFLGDFTLSLYGIFAVCLSTIVIDKVFIGTSQAFVAEIVTESHTEINRAVIEELERTTSVLTIVGGYSGEERKMLMVSFSMKQYAHLLAIINRYDPKAFVTIHRAHEINGEGWTR